MKRFNMISDYLVFSKRERIGISTLLILIITTLLAPALLSKKPKPAPLANSDTAWISQLQSLLLEDSNAEKRNYIPDNDNPGSYQYDHKANISSSKVTLFNFDPNTITKEQWKQLGLSDKTIQIITNYLSKGGHFYKSEDLKKIYGLRENDYQRLEPYITITKSQHFSQSQSPSYSNLHPESRPKPSMPSIVVEINSADKEALIQLPGIGNTFATRIINFRDKLGGFYSIQQVSETYGLPDSTFQKIKRRLQVNESLLKKININTASLEELKAHPYFRNIANVIVNYRKEHGSFTSLENIYNLSKETNGNYIKFSKYLSVE